jgi:hypothetical protein
MIEGMLFLVELLAMLLLLLKVTKNVRTNGEEDLGVFDYPKEQPQADKLKSGGQPRA